MKHKTCRFSYSVWSYLWRVVAVTCRRCEAGLSAEIQPGMNEAGCLAGMINISALYDVVMWATTCECVVVSPSETSVGNPGICHDRWRHD